MVDKKKGRPIYLQCAEEIKKQIQQGVYKQGEPILSEMEMVRTFKISRGSVRKAIQLLSEEGLVETFPGKGTVVSVSKVDYDATHQIGHFSQIIKEAGKVPSARVLEAKFVENVEDKVRTCLNMSLDEKAYYVKRIRYVDGEAWSVEESYFTEEIGRILEQENLEHSIYDILQVKNSKEFEGSQNRIQSMLVTQEISELMDMPVGDPMFKLTRLMFLSGERPFEYGVDYLRGDRMRFSVESNFKDRKTGIKLKLPVHFNDL